MSAKIGVAEVFVEQADENGGWTMKTAYAVTFDGRVMLTRSGIANWSFDEEEAKNQARELIDGNKDATLDF